MKQSRLSRLEKKVKKLIDSHGRQNKIGGILVYETRYCSYIPEWALKQDLLISTSKEVIGVETKQPGHVFVEADECPNERRCSGCEYANRAKSPLP